MPDRLAPGLTSDQLASELGILGSAIGGIFLDTGGAVWNVKAYGAKGDGVADDTLAIQAVMAAAGPVGGTVFFPPGRYLISAPLKWDKSASTTVQLAPSLVGARGYGGPTADVSSTVAISALVASGTFPVGEFMIDYLGPIMPTSTPMLVNTSFLIEGLALECAQRAAGIRCVNEEFATLRGLSVNSTAVPAPANNIGVPQGAINLCSPNPTGFGGGYNTRVQQCAVILAGRDSFFCTEYNTSSVLLEHCVSLQPVRYGFNCGPVTWLRACDSETAGVAEYFVIGTIMESCIIDTFAGSGNGVLFNNANQPWSANPDNSTQFIGCAFIGTNNAVGTEGARALVNVTWENVHAVFVGCTFQAGSGTTDWVWVDSRNSTACQVDFIGCCFGQTLAGTQPSVAKFNLNGAPAAILRFISCRGLNPFGPQAAPAIPATTVALTNPFPFACTVHVAGGVVTAIAVGGTATGLTSGTFRVSVGQTITLTYTAAPTWTWFGE